jgi:hypothetical protein
MATHERPINVNAHIKSSEALISFSNHLMLVLVAIIAFVAGSALQEKDFLTRVIFIIGTFLSFISFYFGYSANINNINLITLSGDIKQKSDEQQIINIKKKIKNRVQLQYFLSLFSIIFISSSLLFYAKNNDKEEYNILSNAKITCTNNNTIEFNCKIIIGNK